MHLPAGCSRGNRLFSCVDKFLRPQMQPLSNG
jgi:hypothetical protein